MSRLARFTCVSLGVALAIWLVPASVHIVDWTAGGPVRVALFAPLWKLWLALAAAVIAGLAIGVRYRGQTDTVSDAAAPLALMWLWAIPYLPWIPDHAPLLLVLAGPLRWGILALALYGSAAAFASGRAPIGGVALPGRRTVFALSLALYLCLGHWSADGLGPDGDEPHYLVITQSLLRDHDLAIENNHQRGDYHDYYAPDLSPDFLRRGAGEVIYSIHAPGLPALLVPAFAVAGYWGAVVTLCLFAALAATGVFVLAGMLAGPAVAWATWAAVCLTVPFVPHAWLIFPEMPAAAVVAWAAIWLYAPLPARARTWIWRGLALAVLPWLHTKFVVLLAVIVGALLLRVWRNSRAAVALAWPVAASLGLWLFFFYRLYGELDPQAPYGDFPTLYVRVANIPRGVLGLLFDQKFGLLMYAPIYLVAIAGCWMMLRRPDARRLALALLAATIAFVASSTRMAMWWGGASAPARFLVPVLPLLAPMIAVALRQMRTAGRATAALLLAISLLVAVDGVAWPRRAVLFSPPHGRAKIVEAMQGPAPLSFMLPTFTDERTSQELARLAPWLLAGLLALVAGMQVKRIAWRVSARHCVYAEVMGFALVSAIAVGAPSAAGRRATAERGRVELIEAYDGLPQRAYGYGRSAGLDARGLFDLAAQRRSRAASELSADPPRLAGPFQLPPGRYMARFWFASAAPRPGAVFVTIGDRQIIARSDGPLANVATLTFDLPVDARVWAGVSDGALARSAQAVEVVADSVVPRSRRPNLKVRALEPIENHPGAFIVYTNADTYPEHGTFWTRGANTGTVSIAAHGASALVLTVHIGAVGGGVRLVVDGHDHTLSLPPNGTRQIEIPVPPGAALVHATVAAATPFRPSDHETGSTDQRWLGCQVRVGLR